MIGFDTLTRKLSASQKELARQGIEQIDRLRRRNDRLLALYEARHKFRQLGIALPPEMRNLEVTIGWPAMAVDVLAERLRIERLTADDKDTAGELTRVWNDNDLTVEGSLAMTDALLFGCEFGIVSEGDPELGEPKVLVTTESPLRMTAGYDRRARRARWALSVDSRNPWGVAAFTLYETDTTTIVDEHGELTVVEHNYGRVPVERMVNRTRTTRRWGDSEMSRAALSYAASAVRTLAGAEVSREFYASPQRWLMGADEESFTRDGKKQSPWEVYIGRFLALARDEDGEVPQVGQFAAASPQPYVDQLKMLSQLYSGETAIPQSYLGFVTDNPSSADAIRAMEARLVMRAEQRQLGFTRFWRSIGELALMVNGTPLEAGQQIGAQWMDAATPTKGATTDAIIKQIQVGVLPPESDVALEELGYSADKILRIQSDRRRAQSTSLVQQLVASSQPQQARVPATEAIPAQPAAPAAA